VEIPFQLCGKLGTPTDNHPLPVVAPKMTSKATMHGNIVPFEFRAKIHLSYTYGSNPKASMSVEQTSSIISVEVKMH
jgi:hypothetical protein